MPILLAGIAYLVIGRVFAWPETHVQAWRLAAWLVSGIVFAAHIGYEHFKLRHAARTMAMHAALGVAAGAFGLAIVGMMHSVSATSAFRPVWLVAFIAWPALTGIPAFIAALAAAALLARLRPRP